MTRMASRLIAMSFIVALVPASALALTPGQAYLKAVQFLRAEGATGWEAVEGQPVLLGEAVAGDPLVAGPRSTTLLASLELASVDARARRARTLGVLGLLVTADADAVEAAQTPGFGYGVDPQHLPTALDTALAVQALDAAGTSPTSPAITDALDDLTQDQGDPVFPTNGMWPLLRTPDAAGGGSVGDIATTAQAVLALKPHVNTGNATWDSAYSAAATALASATPATEAERAFLLLALVEANHPAQEQALDDLVALQQPDGSFGGEPAAADRVYATALAARAIWRAGQLAFPFHSDDDGVADGPDPDSDNDGVCDPGETDPLGGCSGSDAFPTDPDEQSDLDLDGIGDNADLDDDGDGILDADETGFDTNAQEFQDADGDGLADTADPDDDNDGVPDVDELLAGLDPRDVDTDGDSFRDGHELLASKDPLNPLDYPLPDGDVFPLGAPDGVVDQRDELLAHRILRGFEAVPSGALAVFLRHADVAPLEAGAPAPNGGPFDAADALVITRRARGMVAGW